MATKKKVTERRGPSRASVPMDLGHFRCWARSWREQQNALDCASRRAYTSGVAITRLQS